MSSQNNNREHTFTATSDITKYRCVKLSSSSGTTVEHAGAAEATSIIGVAQHSALTGELVTVKLFGAGEIYKVTSGNDIVTGRATFAAAAGRLTGIKDSNGVVGYALGYASYDGFFSVFQV